MVGKKMNAHFSHPNFLNNKLTNIVSPYTEEDLKRQLYEVVDQGHYKSGLAGKDKEMTILDCGANIGIASLYFQPHAKVIYACEPNADYYQYLLQNTKDYENILPFNVAVGTFNGSDTLFASGEATHAESFFAQGKVRETVKCVTFDKFFENNNIEHLDLLKIDVEGAEYPIFCSEGFTKVASKIDGIVGEAHYVDQFIPAFIPTILEEQGFKVKFESIKNMWKKISYTLSNGQTKEYNLELQTIFTARR